MNVAHEGLTTAIDYNFKLIQTQITKKPTVIYSCKKRKRKR